MAAHRFDFRSNWHQVANTFSWQVNHLRLITNTKVNSAFHPSGVGKSSISLSGWD